MGMMLKKLADEKEEKRKQKEKENMFEIARADLMAQLVANELKIRRLRANIEFLEAQMATLSSTKK